MRVPVDLILDTVTDTLMIRVPAADGDGDVTLLDLPASALTDDQKRRLRHIRDEAQADSSAAETQFVLAQAIPTLRQWAAQADAHTVTSGNAVATVQKITDNLAIFYAHFADLLEMQYGPE